MEAHVLGAHFGYLSRETIHSLCLSMSLFHSLSLSLSLTHTHTYTHTHTHLLYRYLSGDAHESDVTVSLPDVTVSLPGVTKDR
jgi:hypothetical protein